MRPADLLPGTPAGAAPGAESAEVRKPRIHAGLRAGGECGKSAEEVRNLSLFSVPACRAQPSAARPGGPAPVAGLPPSLVAHIAETRREDGPRRPPSSAGADGLACMARECEPGANQAAGRGQVLTHPAFDRPPVPNLRRPGRKAGAVSLSAERRKRHAGRVPLRQAGTDAAPRDVLADAIQRGADRPLTAWELHCARAELADASGPPDPATERQTILAALTILEGRMRRPGAQMCSPADLRQFLALHMAPRDREAFGVLFLDVQHRLIRFEVLFTGTLMQTPVYPREVVRRALALNAAAVVLAHNHPSGNPEPSPADRQLTVTLQLALRLVDVRVVDHLVIGWPGVVSFAERGLL